MANPVAYRGRMGVGTRGVLYQRSTLCTLVMAGREGAFDRSRDRPAVVGIEPDGALVIGPAPGVGMEI